LFPGPLQPSANEGNERPYKPSIQPRLLPCLELPLNSHSLLNFLLVLIPPAGATAVAAAAVGVDNMFILAHSLADQLDPRAPLPHRVGLALAGVGPSITLAASCEVVAFAMGAMTSMPALRNFSACAALAVALDYLLQASKQASKQWKRSGSGSDSQPRRGASGAVGAGHQALLAWVAWICGPVTWGAGR
jgi:hypothetical protein